MTVKNLRAATVLLVSALLVLVASSTDVVTDTSAADPATAAKVTSAAIASPAAKAAPAPVASTAAGALFAGGRHFCSASVVHSVAGDVVLTAAHCVNGRSGLSFAPGYHDGIAPYGQWQVTGVFVANGWTTSADPDLDFAFLTVHRPGDTRAIESVTGANTLGAGRGFTNTVTLTGYPDTTDSPVTCRNTTTQSGPFQQRVECPGFPDGTSGGPWVAGADPATGLGEVVGVIGGYQLGGATPDVSYSAYFDTDIQNLFATVTG
ncbi:trypsin-like serine peptidase [Amycolatopsis sp. NPDC059021]|uniref:trypsin-like serine peptidase n=1 Tax=Amycolatopsis sp. NPDC059021 TaxID=3346704 RepID=UPI00366E03C3